VADAGFTHDFLIDPFYHRVRRPFWIQCREQSPNKTAKSTGALFPGLMVNRHPSANQRRIFMTFEEIKAAVLKLSEADQKRLLTEVVPLLWPKACVDDSCLAKIRELVDESTVKEYREQHMGTI
jgi:hypothetical protein